MRRRQRRRDGCKKKRRRKSFIKPGGEKRRLDKETKERPEVMREQEKGDRRGNKDEKQPNDKEEKTSSCVCAGRGADEDQVSAA